MGFRAPRVPAMVVAATGFARVLAVHTTRPSDWASAELSHQSPRRKEASSRGTARLIAGGAKVALHSLGDWSECLRHGGPVSRARSSIAVLFSPLAWDRLCLAAPTVSECFNTRARPVNCVAWWTRGLAKKNCEPWDFANSARQSTRFGRIFPRRCRGWLYQGAQEV